MQNILQQLCYKIFVITVENHSAVCYIHRLFYRVSYKFDEIFAMNSAPVPTQMFNERSEVVS